MPAAHPGMSSWTRASRQRRPCVRAREARCRRHLSTRAGRRDGPRMSPLARLLRGDDRRGCAVRGLSSNVILGRAPKWRVPSSETISRSRVLRSSVRTPLSHIPNRQGSTHQPVRNPAVDPRASTPGLTAQWASPKGDRRGLWLSRSADQTSWSDSLRCGAAFRLIPNVIPDAGFASAKAVCPGSRSEVPKASIGLRGTSRWTPDVASCEAPPG